MKFLLSSEELKKKKDTVRLTALEVAENCDFDLEVFEYSHYHKCECCGYYFHLEDGSSEYYYKNNPASLYMCNDCIELVEEEGYSIMDIEDIVEPCVEDLLDEWDDNSSEEED